jgi:hypothetical protein
MDADLASPWAAHRDRARVLADRHPFAGEVLGLYLALLDVWDEGRDLARNEPPAPDSLPEWTVRRMVPLVVKATEAAGPEALATEARELSDADGVEGTLAAWLAGAALPPVEAYLARASLRAPLAGLDAEPAEPATDRLCPACGGPPQLSVRAGADEALVTGGRQLACARCWRTWNYSASACPSCGETTGTKRTMYAETSGGPIVRGVDSIPRDSFRRGRRSRDPAFADPALTDTALTDTALTDTALTETVAGPPPVFPHLRVEACASCQRYLLDVDLGRDARAVPEVDELAALPLDLYAAEHGLVKVTPNLMGF